MNFDELHFSADGRQKALKKVASGHDEGLTVVAGMKGEALLIQQRTIHNEPNRLRRIKQQAHGAYSAGMHLHNFKQLALIGKAQPRGTDLLGYVGGAQAGFGANEAEIEILLIFGCQEIILDGQTAEGSVHSGAIVNAMHRRMCDGFNGNIHSLEALKHLFRNGHSLLKSFPVRFTA